MEPIPPDWTCSLELKRYFVRESIKYVYKETYVKNENRVIILNDEPFTTIYYYYKDILIARYFINGNILQRSEPTLTIGNLSQKGYVYDNFKPVEEPWPTFQETKKLIPPVWKNPKYFEWLTQLKIFEAYHLDITSTTTTFKNNHGIDEKIPIGLDWATMQLCHTSDIFCNFTKNSCLLVDHDNVYHVEEDTIHYVYKDEIEYYSDWENVQITRKIFPAMDNLFELIEQNLPQPIWEEILPHLLNPKE